jgi:FAD:protein FMN transferase
MVGTQGNDTPESFARIANLAFNEIDALEARISSWQRGSQTSEINNNAFERPVRVTPTVLKFLQTAQRIARETDGAFDCTVGPLIDLWRTARDQESLPTHAEIEAALQQCGYENIEIDPEYRTVRFLAEGMRLNFGAIGKGHALDEAAQILEQYGVEIALLDAGGSTYLATGIPPNEAGWTVRVHQPYNMEETLAEVVLGVGAFSTSTNAGAKMVVDGRAYGHIIDPRTGWPAEGKRLAMALAPTAAEADALSTAFYVMDEASIRRYCGSHPEIQALVAPETGPELIRINFENGED